MNGLQRYGGVVGLVALGLILRFWNLDLKPLWMDETITLLFALGRRYDDIPREVLQPLPQLLGSLTWHPQSCGAIAQAIQAQSTHPPLFFCLMHQWMGWLHPSGLSLRWQVRSLPALWGTGVILAIYGVNRVALSHRAGLWAAGLMAVSPYGIYLSQEGRHYTLPMLIITLSLIPMMQLVQAKRQTLIPWLAWVALHSLGFYVHYFCLLAFVAQVAALVLVFWQQRRSLVSVGVASVGVGLSLLPGLPWLLNHSQRPETDWLQFKASLGWHWLEPLLRLLGGCIITVVLLPVEDQPLPIVLCNGVLMLSLTGWVGWQLWQRRSFWQTRSPSIQALGYFVGAVGLEYLGLVYGLHKDLTLAFRYNFIFYPALCALLAAWSISPPLGQAKAPPWTARLPLILVGCGLLSASFLVTNHTFLKPFAPQATAQRLGQVNPTHLAIVKDYRSGQDIALGLSEALAFEQFYPVKTLAQAPHWGFVKTLTPQSLTLKIAPLLKQPWAVWRVSRYLPDPSQLPGQRFQLTLQDADQAQTSVCTAQQPPHNHQGVVYQPFQCAKPKASP